MDTALEGIYLQDTGIVRVSGADAVKFLQGQLSNDIAKLGARQSLLAGYHNPQGRTLAVLRLVQWNADDILILLPRELAGVVASRLAKYVLRAKSKVADESVSWRVVGLIDAGPVDGADSATDLPVTVGTQGRGGDTLFVRVGDRPPRWLAISPADAPSSSLDYTPVDHATWQRLEVAAGQPHVYAATSEEFVAQMLNLDCVGGIAFDKGCYTGQEVIARAHYRGRVKRRMQRFVSRGPCQLSPGDSGQLADGRTFKVVLSAPLADGRCDFLAVTSIAGTDAATGAAVGARGTGAAASAGAAGTGGSAASGGAAAEAGASPVATAGVTTQAVHPQAAPMTDPAAPPVPGPIIDPTLAPVAAASVAPTVAAAAALTAAPPVAAPTDATATPPVPVVDAAQVDLPYSLPD
jgi:folate-binding protein YgfZ